jgi:hypothetical protein
LGVCKIYYLHFIFEVRYHFSKKHLPIAPVQLGLKILGLKCPATFTSQEGKEVESICALDFFKEFGFIRKKFSQWIIGFFDPFQFTKYEKGSPSIYRHLILDIL